LWVLQKLKKLADKGSERTQLEAAKLLGQTMNMFQPETIVSNSEDPSAIIKAALEKRKKDAEKAEEINEPNVLPFKATTN
jgi:hypothetical protein